MAEVTTEEKKKAGRSNKKAGENNSKQERSKKSKQARSRSRTTAFKILVSKRNNSQYVRDPS